MTDTKHLDEAARLAGFENWSAARNYSHRLDCQSIRAHADTLAKLEAKTAEFEAFRVEVSEFAIGVKDYMACCKAMLWQNECSRFIIEKPDPLVEALACLVPLTPTPHSGETHAQAMARELRSELARHGLAIVEASHDRR